jgi:hypothetical protein
MRTMMMAAALLLATGSALAQKAALVQNIDDDARVPYQVFQFGANCNSPGDCAIVFPAVPAGRRVVIEHLSCFVSLQSGSLTAPITVGSQYSNARNFAIASATGPSYVANSSVLLYVEAGDQPRVDALSSGPYSVFFCNLTGRSVAIP